jgi:hypothetical protein
VFAIFRRAIVLPVALLAFSSVAIAQGHVTGIVRDADGKPLKGATVTVENPDVAPSTFTSTSDSKGRFNLLGLRGGTWKVTVQAPGYTPETTTITTRSLGQNPTLDVTLPAKRQSAPAGPLEGMSASALQQQLDAAAALAAKGKDTEAIAAYRQIASRTPALTSIHLAVAALLERQHDYAGARAEYNALLAAEPDNAEAKAALDRISK